jgi:polysaccharide chain length determinant protein (PEP-CTERM system associated)
MDFALLFAYAKVIARELWNKKYLVLVAFSLISFSILLVGSVWPPKYVVSATIYADNQNILGPLLKEKAEQKKVEGQTKIVKDTLHSPRILKSVAEKLFDPIVYPEHANIADVISKLRNGIQVTRLGSGYMKVQYSDQSSDKAYNGLNTIIDVFIRSSAEEQRAESREAFLFIENQVKQYKDQLVSAEESLKEFSAVNFDGRDADVNASIRRIRTQMDELGIRIDEDRTVIRELEGQLTKEKKYSPTKRVVSAYTKRLKSLESRLQDLLLNYTEDYPDVVSVRQQIQDLKEEIEMAKTEGNTVQATPEEVELNPIYVELRSGLSKANTSIRTKRKRISVLEDLLEKEFDRRKRVAARGADEAELTRDYRVTKKIYEDMLERKEKARLSMTLNIEGQGVTYRVQDPPLPPRKPTGLRFLHFVLLGPLLGMLVIIGFTVALVLIDPRIRFPSRLEEIDVRFLGHVPHISTGLTKRLRKSDFILVAVSSLLILALYVCLAAAFRFGYLG